MPTSTHSFSTSRKNVRGIRDRVRYRTARPPKLLPCGPHDAFFPQAGARAGLTDATFD